MMKKLVLAMASLLGVTLMGSTAQAVDAGWDFSQFAVPGALTGGSNPLPANYSAQDPNGAGAGAAAFGSLSWSGTLLPTAGESRNPLPYSDGPIRSNTSEDFQIGETSFNAFSLLKAEGQTYASPFAVVATSASTLTFEVTPPGSGTTGLTVSFGAKIQGGGGPNGGPLSCDPIGGPFTCASTISVEHAPDCSSYSSYAPAVLSLDDERYSIALDPTTDTDAYCVRLGLDPSDGAPVIDNVVFVPEPGSGLHLLASLAMLGVLVRHKRRR